MREVRGYVESIGYRDSATSKLSSIKSEVHTKVNKRLVYGPRSFLCKVL